MVMLMIAYYKIVILRGLANQFNIILILSIDMDDICITIDCVICKSQNKKGRCTNNDLEMRF